MLAALLIALSMVAPAEVVDASRLDAALPSDQNLSAMEAQMQQNPTNLDSYFSYSQMAMQLGEYDKAAAAMEHMLTVDPSLDRVRLDLSLAYTKMERYEDARNLLQEVLKKDVPEQVKHNIQTVLKQLDEATKLHTFTGSVSTGLVHDSNGNSISSSGSVTVFDTSIPLSPAQQAKEDFQWFGTATVNHRYRPLKPIAEGVAMEWNSSGGVYQTEQQYLDELNLKAISLKSGPTFAIDALKLRSTLTANYTQVLLDNHSYLKIYSADLDLDHVFPSGVHLLGGAAHEFREFINSPTVTTYVDRSGPAEEARIGLGYAFTERTYGDVIVTLRHEDTKRGYYDNNQISPAASLIHQFDDQVFTQIQATFRESLYDEPDTFISSRKRRDLDKSFQILLGKNFENNISLTASYQYRTVNSTIENYEYDNHRLMTSMGWRF